MSQPTRMYVVQAADGERTLVEAPSAKSARWAVVNVFKASLTARVATSVEAFDLAQRGVGKLSRIPRARKGAADAAAGAGRDA